MIFKSFVVSIVSVIIFLCALGLLTYFISPKDYEAGEFVQLLFYGGGTLIPIVFGIVLLINGVVNGRIRSKKIKSPETIYFFCCSIFTVIPILAFVIFDYSDRGRYFEEKTFLTIAGEYAVYFLLAVFVIFLNRKISWDNFKAYKPRAATR